MNRMIYPFCKIEEEEGVYIGFSFNSKDNPVTLRVEQGLIKVSVISFGDQLIDKDCDVILREKVKPYELKPLFDKSQIFGGTTTFRFEFPVSEFELYVDTDQLYFDNEAGLSYFISKSF